MFRRLATSKLAKATYVASAALGLTVVYLDFIKSPNKPLVDYTNFQPLSTQEKNVVKPPTRQQLLQRLKDGPTTFDTLIIGGGAVGSGVAVDAVTRGLSVCLLEREDFASGTSSKSTKMAHGGVRYLEKAIFQLLKDQLDLVIEALNERANMMRTAPHLVSVLPILIPVYKWWQIPYFYAGCKMYDWFAGYQNLRSSTLYLGEHAKAAAPMIESSNLKAACLYHDGSFNDARMNATLALTAIENGATVLNYMNVVQLLKQDSKVIGVIAQDRETGETFQIKAKSVVNATGPFADQILEMDKDPKGLPPLIKQLPKMVVPSSGVHIVLPEYYGPKEMGLLDPSTEDGRVMFFLPWQGKVLAGTTDTPLKEVPDSPVAKEDEINDILNELQKYINFKVEREDVLSAWSGVRPLVKDPSIEENNGKTEGLVRSHLITTSPTGLVTILGGKWTTYREMAEETVNTIISTSNLEPKRPCQTNSIILAGGENYHPGIDTQLIHEYHIPAKLATHWANNYGTRSVILAKLYISDPLNRLPIELAGKIEHPKELLGESFMETEPFTVAELKYAMNYEYARTPVDFLARRTRLAFLNAKEAYVSIDAVVNIMGRELGWNRKTAEQMKQDAEDYIGKMGIRPQ
ncbi:mitochondrial glycerol-3-phosphate dehydrogenase [Scheffersomyces spartinae]|uniref:Glycerol-3-phosphate dehydrogenase n=1 Tax=Scheffersomyces spartinae TaxID=45513 RepID=A0A9P8AID7_9ASCO|nr:mitochondrial glycerol-3-phosphate dehydrogenase [Scheffersomyces spartinae]KAG7193753.1 mitochondrial glycerol-3-phosphate dehydrogenase [Scheffersomyces spartinae]